MFGLIFVSLVTDYTVARGDIITAIFPLLRGEYWFFSAYIGMLLLSGLINSAVRNTENKTLFVLLAVLFCFTMVELVEVKLGTTNLLFNLNKGYSCIWLSFMYFIGAVMRKTNVYKLAKNKGIACICIVAGLKLFSWVWMVCIYKAISSIFVVGSGWNRLFVEYISPTIVISAALIVAVFANLSMERMTATRKLISFAAPSAFSIYLMNSQPLIAKCIYNAENLSFLNDYNYFGLAALTIAVSAAFAVAAIIIDKFRETLFRIFGIKNLITRIKSSSINEYQI